MGLRTWDEMLATRPVLRDDSARRAAGEVTTRLLQAGGLQPSDWEVVVFAEPTVNAFALPGRKIGIFEGMLGVARDRAGLAAVVGHEIGHLEADHSIERARAAVAAGVGLNLAAWLLSANDVPFSQEIAAALGVGTEFGLVRPYGRRQELEADRFGVFLMAEAGYDPESAALMWERMSRLDQAGPPAFLSTHPAPGDRVEAIRDMIPEALDAAGRR